MENKIYEFTLIVICALCVLTVAFIVFLIGFMVGRRWQTKAEKKQVQDKQAKKPFSEILNSKVS